MRAATFNSQLVPLPCGIILNLDHVLCLSPDAAAGQAPGRLLVSLGGSSQPMSLPLEKVDAVALLTELSRRDVDVESVSVALGVRIPHVPRVVPPAATPPVIRPSAVSADPWRNNGA